MTNKFDNIKERVLQLAEFKGFGKRDFCEKIGMTYQNFTGKAKETPLNSNAMKNIFAIIPDVSLEWLLTGKGEMIRTDVQIIHNPPYSEKREERVVYLYDVNAAANLKTLLINKDQNILGEIVIPDAPVCDGAVYVNGDSMYPLLKSGDIIAYKETSNLDHLVYGEMYLISFDLDGDEFLTVKYIKKSSNKDCITLVSYNPHHEPMDIPKSSIRALAIVKFSIRKNTMR